ncbi:MAG: transcription-repair coupling factor [Ignavibacteriae bacterium]|nr:MAG: transcription-repair coupling factor [Ignavibacteriota bacterium]
MQNLKDKIFKAKEFEEIKTAANTFITGISGSLKSFVVYDIFDRLNNQVIFCSTDQTSLFKLKDDLNVINGTEVASIYLNNYDEEFESEVSPLSSTLRKLSSGEKFILMIEPSVLEKSIITEESFKSNIISIKKNEDYGYDTLLEKLKEFNFNRKNVVEEENDYAVRGGIIDIFPENLNQPVRIEFFGNEVESIREFDLTTQRSISQLSSVEILPSLDEFENIQSSSNRLINYIKDNQLLLLDEPDLLKKENEEIFNSLLNYNRSYFSVFPLAKSDSITNKENIYEVSFKSSSQPPFHSNIKLLYSNLKELCERDYDIHITATDDYQTKRIRELIEDIDEGNILSNISYFDNSVHEGFVLPAEKIAVYTEHEVFERYFRAAKRRRKFAGITFRELNKINFGDFMVHQTYGIGKYAGLRKIKVAGVEQEAVKLLYQENDVVFVNLNSLNQLKRYSAQEGHVPKLNRLGGSEWEKVKARTKKKIQDIAKDLILLYSKRKNSKGLRFSPDTVWQKELEASFIYEDTPDQISATDAVKIDMESDYPMDRLICGDVGFGKTEVAIRAAFKAVMDNLQVAVLVPTTILAEQHYNTFKDRLSNWAVEVEHLSRFKNKKEQKEILEKLVDGKINIIIGTHRLLSKDVDFKALGLLVIDEEQRFGVKAKEKLKMMRENIDVLTLTATPIPRTLNFSLLGARDLSIINTPPKNRQPIHTEIINFDKKLISNAIVRELHRNGQVYFVNDRISKLDELADIITDAVPYAKVAIAHGQMTPVQLENVMMKFLEKKYNVLVCTKIIESGLDIPSVNTIIINRADNFGLAELYQLRGRVGRSNIKSYAYLVTPPHSTLTKQAIRRLHALEEFTELGSGLNLALKDLEIRGAGNLLGKEQSGFIAEIGFDMYMQILDEAVTELRDSELGAVIPELIPKDKTKAAQREVSIETDVSILIPEWYIEDENERLIIYQRLSKTNSPGELQTIKEEMLDRFGKYPDEVISLFKFVEMKIAASTSYFDKITIFGKTAELYFDLSEKTGKFSDEIFGKIANYISSGNNNLRFMQTKKTLMLRYSLNNTNNEKLHEVREVLETVNGL